jgi:hypothetical protein
MLLTHLRPTSPYRPPQWRWELAKRYKSDLRALTENQDYYLRNAFTLIRALERCRDDWERIDIYDSMPAGLTDAYDCFTEERLNRFRWEVEARLLAGMTDAEISAETGLTESAVRFYENVFFHCRDRLGVTTWVVQVAIPTPIQYGLTERDLDTLWKVFGYFSGPPVLKSVITCNYRVGHASASSVEAARDLQIFSNIAHKAMLASRIMGVNQFSGAQMLESHVRLQELAQASGDTQSNRFLTVMGEILSSIPWTMGYRLDGSKFTGAEPRVADLIARGHDAAHAELSSIEFPKATINV